MGRLLLLYCSQPWSAFDFVGEQATNESCSLMLLRWCLLCPVLGFDEERLSKVFQRNFMVLTSDLEDKIKPTLAALQSVLGSQEGVVAAVAKEPNLLVSAVETLEGNVEVMLKLGLSSSDIRKSVGKQPQLFGLDYKQEVFQAKLRYFEVVLGRGPRHMLVEQPAILKTALWRVDYRVSCCSPVAASCSPHHPKACSPSL